MARKTWQAPEPISARPKRARVASPQAVSDAGESDAAERQEDDPLLDNPGVTSKKMSWRMLLASTDGMRAEEGVSAQSDNSNAVHHDCAEWQYLEQDRHEQASLEKASADAHNMEECLWCSDTTSAALEQSFRVRVKAEASRRRSPGAHVHEGGGGGIARCPVLARTHACVHP